jgi:hypothetical protein
MFLINSPLSQFEVTNLIGIFTSLFSHFYAISISFFKEALYLCTNVNVLDLFEFLFQICIYFKDSFTIFFIFLCGSFLIAASLTRDLFSVRKLGEKIIRNAGTIGEGEAGLVTTLDSAFNLADRMKGSSSGSGEPAKYSEKNKAEDSNSKDNKEDSTDDKNPKIYLNSLFNFIIQLYLTCLTRFILYFYFFN